MAKAKRKKTNGLPSDWATKASEKLALMDIQKTANQVSKIFGGIKKNDPDQKKVLEMILEIKNEYQKEKEELKQMRDSILS